MARACRKRNASASGEAEQIAQAVFSGPGPVACGYREACTNGKLHIYHQSLASHRHDARHGRRIGRPRQRQSGVCRDLWAVQETPGAAAQGLRVEAKAPTRPDPGLSGCVRTRFWIMKRPLSGGLLLNDKMPT